MTLIVAVKPPTLANRGNAPGTHGVKPPRASSASDSAARSASARSRPSASASASATAARASRPLHRRAASGAECQPAHARVAWIGRALEVPEPFELGGRLGRRLLGDSHPPGELADRQRAGHQMLEHEAVAETQVAEAPLAQPFGDPLVERAGFLRLEPWRIRTQRVVAGEARGSGRPRSSLSAPRADCGAARAARRNDASRM